MFVLVIILILVFIPGALPAVKEVIGKGADMLNQTLESQDSSVEVVEFDLIVAKQCDDDVECNENIPDCENACYCDSGTCKKIVET